MNTWPIVAMTIIDEADISVARQRARLIASHLGFGEQDQTRIATAVSEIARNAFAYAHGGRVEFAVEDSTPAQEFVIQVSDEGGGIAELAAMLAGHRQSRTGLGLGVRGARRLMDRFQIESSAESGTLVRLGKLLPADRRVTAADAVAVADKLTRDRLHSPLAEARAQNQDLVRSLDQLQQQQAELEARANELVRVGRELEAKNRGIVALNQELDARAAELARSNERFRLAVGAAAIGTWEYDAATDVFICDERTKELFGLPADADLTEDKFLAALHPDDRDRVRALVLQALDPAGSGELEAEYRTVGLEDGIERWLASSAKAVFENGKAIRFAGVLRDIGFRKQAEALTRQAMEHQEILTREVGHRVKNSLQLVSALLEMQARASTDPSVQSAMEQAGARITTVAKVHDHLWRQKDVQSIDLAAFLRDLCENLQATAPHHQLKCDVESIMVSTDIAIPIGLLTNELVTNAVKYAYPDGGGPVDVRCIVAGDRSRVHVEVSDQGVGLPETFDIRKPSQSLGSKLIVSLAQQLDAELEVIHTHPGVCFAIDIAT